MKRKEPLIETEPPVEVADGKELIEKKLREELPLAGVKISEIVVEEENYERIGAQGPCLRIAAFWRVTWNAVSFLM